MEGPIAYITNGVRQGSRLAVGELVIQAQAAASLAKGPMTNGFGPEPNVRTTILPSGRRTRE
jgi:hypothetical protein